MSEWHLITCEYPPQPGGVSDYTHVVASGLAAAGDVVHVWCPASRGETPAVPGVTVHRHLNRIAPADLRRVSHRLDGFPGPRRILVQWVPHGYGYWSMNLGFCLWLRRRASHHRDHVEIMVHEPYLAFGEGSWKQEGAAAVHRVMTAVLLSAARRVWVSVPAWARCWRPYAFRRRVSFAWLPVPSSIPVVDDAAGVSTIRAQYAPDGALLVGHFGTGGRLVSTLLVPALRELLGRHAGARVLLLGRGLEPVREELIRGRPDLIGRAHAAGALEAVDISRHLSACDLMIQPYPDGVSGRRTSVMAGLAHRLPIVTTVGPLTESCWIESGAVALAPTGQAAALVDIALRLLGDAAERARLTAAAKAFYAERFDARHTITALRSGRSE